ncbi:MAG: SCO family protein [Rhodospirillaceae bacterium]|nr:SCO family protein [Rhodospirillaceae bacterium]
MPRIDAMTRAIPLPILVLVYVLACVWAIFYAAGVADAQDGGAGAAPETGIAPRTTVLQSADAAAEHVHEGHDTAGMPDFGDPLQDIVVDFELVGRGGGTVTAEDFRGRHVLLGFGFTHCPDVCPLMALNMGKALRDAEDDAVGIFISVDTERDSPEITDRYASRFGERMIGLSGNVSQINAAANNFKVSYVVTKSQNNYTVQHSANVFLIDPDGRVVDVFNFSTPGEELAAAMRHEG